MVRKILLLLFTIFVITFSADAKEYFVDGSTGSDFASGTAENPYKTIQKAVKDLKPGDVVTVMPGVYYGPVNITSKGTKDNPIIIRSECNEKNSTIITNANEFVREKNANWELFDEELNIWVTDYNVTPDTDNGLFVYEEEDFFPAVVMCDDVELMVYNSIDDMRNFIYNKNDKEKTYMPGVPRGYYYDNSMGKLYIMLDKKSKYRFKTPAEHIIKISPSKYTYFTYGKSGYQSSYGDCIGADSYCIRVGEISPQKNIDAEIVADSYYVVIDGFTFETPGVCGVFCHSSDVTVKNCYFVGCRSGVRGATRCNREDMIYSENIVIENCDYGRSEFYYEAKEIIEKYNNNPKKMDFINSNGMDYKINEYYWWARKSERQSFNQEVGGIATRMGEKWIIRNCYIHDCFDGISYAGMDKYGYYDTYKDSIKPISYSAGSRYIEICGNKFERCLDNCIEVENHGRDISIYSNLFYNNFIPFSWQPLGREPLPTNITFYKNVIHNTRDFNDFWKDNTGYILRAFKIGASNENWYNSETGEYNLPNQIVLEDKGISIFNNTIVMPGGRLFTNVGSNSKKEYRTNNIPFENFNFINNIVVCDTSPGGKNRLDMNDIKIQDVELYGINFVSNVFCPDYGGNIVVKNEALLNNCGSIVCDAEKLGFEKITRLSLKPELTENSYLRSRGCIEYENINSALLCEDVGAVAFGEIFSVNAGVEQR